MPDRPLRLIMIVDDDQAVRDAFQFALQLEGFSVHVHDTAPALLADPDLARAACVVLDDRMPRLDGIGLLKDLQARKIMPPTILLTSHATVELRARAEIAGVHLVLEKPLLENTLIDCIRSVL
jgi:two-component system response regulator FixJ